MTRRLIEEWLPAGAIGMESLRERTPMTPFPAPNRLHVWFARRPLVASRAAILASLLPADADHDKFMHILGIHGDPVASRRRIDMAKRTGNRFEGEAYSYSRAFSYIPSKEEQEWFLAELTKLGIEKPSVLDPTAGGGSIPFEALRLGLDTLANDLNPVAATILKQTLETPIKYGVKILYEFERLSKKFITLREERLTSFYPKEPQPNCISTNYLFTRTINCPYCDRIVPLSPNWKLAPDGTGIRLNPNLAQGICEFKVVSKAKDQSVGTVKGGDALCCYSDCQRVIDGIEIKRQAQAGQMGDQLFAIVYKERIQTTTKSGKPGKDKWKRGYRAPLPSDDNLAEIKARLEEKLIEWEALDYVPSEKVPEDINDGRPIQYGMSLWRDLFSPRQLLCHGTSVEVFREFLEEEQKGAIEELTKAAFVYLSFALDKLRDYNSRMTRWHSNREVMVNTFDRHDFSFKWSYAEMAPLIEGLGYDWAIEQTGKCIKELIELSRPDIDLKTTSVKSKQLPLISTQEFIAPSITITCRSGDDLNHLEDASIDAVVIDPPYYDNVMYAELSDFFYVWLKRTAGYVYPEFFTRQLTDKENEAVANPAKFGGQKGAKALANKDYQELMAAIFAECRRVLNSDGILTLMFTHKAQGAWDALATGLLEAGFIITAWNGLS